MTKLNLATLQSISGGGCAPMCPPPAPACGCPAPAPAPSCGAKCS